MLISTSCSSCRCVSIHLSTALKTDFFTSRHYILSFLVWSAMTIPIVRSAINLLLRTLCCADSGTVAYRSLNLMTQRSQRCTQALCSKTLIKNSTKSFTCPSHQFRRLELTFSAQNDRCSFSLATRCSFELRTLSFSRTVIDHIKLQPHFKHSNLQIRLPNSHRTSKIWTNFLGTPLLAASLVLSSY